MHILVPNGDGCDNIDERSEDTYDEYEMADTNENAF